MPHVGVSLSFLLYILFIGDFMSDGNYNRNFLPYNNYQSGLRAGRAQVKRLALECFDCWLQDAFPALTDEDRLRLSVEYKALLDQNV